MSRKGSLPAIAPMSRELTAKPAYPHVMTKPIAVPVMRGNSPPTIATVVGKTGAIERPATKTSAEAKFGLFVCSIRNVVRAMAIEATRATVTAGTRIRIGDMPMRPMSKPSANPSERMLSARDSGTP